MNAVVIFQQIGCRLFGNDRTGHFYHGTIKRDFVWCSGGVRHRTKRNFRCIHHFLEVSDAQLLHQFISRAAYALKPLEAKSEHNRICTEAHYLEFTYHKSSV